MDHMKNNAFYVPESALVIAAHPDDIEYICAGTVARWVRHGAHVGYVIITDGDVGISEPGMTRQRAGEIRRAEQRQAAKIAGVKDVVFLGEPDGLLEATLLLRKRLVREIRRFKPEVVICQDPTMLWESENYINHPDHRAAGLATLDAVFPAAGQPLLFQELEEEGLQAHKVRKVFAVAWDKPNLYVNIEETIDIKVKALKAHKSQINGSDVDSFLRQWGADIAKGKEMAYAEAFRVVTLEDDEKWYSLHPQN